MNTSLVQKFTWFTIVSGTVLAFNPPNTFLFRFGENYIVPMMFSYLALGLLFLAFRDQKSMFVSFICCAILCLIPRTREPFFPLEKQGKTSFTVANFNISNSNDDYETTIKTILNADADVISLQEVTPNWEVVFKNELVKEYPYYRSFPRIDFYGLAVYSKYPLTHVDTFNCSGIPNIIGSFKTEDSLNNIIHFVSSHTSPPLNTDAYEKIREQFSLIANKISDIDAPILTIGDYNIVPWASEILTFRKLTSLKDSRRYTLPNAIPVDHIFYSNELECTDFKNVSGGATNHLGIVGTYQVNEQGNYYVEETIN